jgi:hypothetical protein
MKNTLVLFSLIGIIFFGCSDNSDNTDISAPTSINNLTKDQSFTSDQEIESTSHILSITKLIDGEVGGELSIDTIYINYQGRQIDVFANLKIKKSAFQGLTLITMMLNPEAAKVKFFPDLIFTNDVKLSVTYTGIDLEALGYTTSGHYDFVYFGKGGVETTLNDESKVDMDKQEIKVKNAKLEHFSRYGWLK